MQNAVRWKHGGARRERSQNRIEENPKCTAMIPENSYNKIEKTLPKCCACQESNSRKTDPEKQITMAQPHTPRRIATKLCHQMPFKNLQIKHEYTFVDSYTFDSGRIFTASGRSCSRSSRSRSSRSSGIAVVKSWGPGSPWGRGTNLGCALMIGRLEVDVTHPVSHTTDALMKGGKKHPPQILWGGRFKP